MYHHGASLWEWGAAICYHEMETILQQVSMEEPNIKPFICIIGIVLKPII